MIIGFLIVGLILCALGVYIGITPLWSGFVVLGPLLAVALYDRFQSKNSILRNFPLIGRMRYVSEWMRPKIRQYFIESDTDGRPFSKLERDLVHHRAEDSLDTVPFGTQLNVYGAGYEWMNHSINPLNYDKLEQHPRCRVGGPDCLQPYDLSLYNVSAMSYGSLSKNAIEALNAAAKIGGFAHNTGEGGISPYHLRPGGDLIYQIGTGYFGCRAADGGFSAEEYKKRTAETSVKMIELKLSQGAKPGHGGILPARKVTQEISEIRGVPMGKDVLSPPYHKEFNTPKGLLNFIKQLRDLSGGKPVGFKLCIGDKSEFLSICKAMVATGIKPDFITIDGGEGGTGAAPIEFSDTVGMPMKEGLAFAFNALLGFDLKKDIKLIAAGRIVTGFDIFRALAIGADACYSARAMMMALGCIQALECNQNTCPTGVATNKPKYLKGLVVEDKKHKVAHFHKDTIHSFVELQGASGHELPEHIDRSDIYRRIEQNYSQRYDQIYPYISKGCLLSQESYPEEWSYLMGRASTESFRSRFVEAFE